MSQTKTRKTTVTGLVLLVIFAALTAVGFFFHSQIYSPDSWFLSNPTEVGIVDAILALVPKLVSMVQVLFVTLLVLYIVCSIIGHIFKGTPRRLTIGKLINSIVKVVIWAVCVIAILAVWGIDVAALIAGAGVLTLIIGLGMQSLIADVVAGVFIVCDGTLQVGDVVTIDGWRGTVQEIGIRNTKLINYSGDIRIANNSTIKVFINQSREVSYPTVQIGITYGEDIAKVEKIFEENRDAIKEKIPAIISGPDYKGVAELASSSVNLLFGATCKEEDFPQVQRDLNRELKVLFDENGISIPFPQVDVHQK